MDEKKEKGLNKMTGVELDPLILADKDFVKQIKAGELKLPEADTAESLLKFIDNVKNKDTVFVQYAKKFKKITMLKNGIRDPRAYVDIKNLAKFRNDLEAFQNKASKLDVNDFKSFIKKAKIAKSANILTNVALSSVLLAYALPKAQFAFRKFITGSDLEPGLAPAEKIVDKKA